MHWELLDGPHEVAATRPAAVARGWRINRDEEPPREVTVFIADDVMATNNPVDLPEAVMEARISEGESAVVTILEWPEPPREIFISTDGLEYGDAGT